MKFSAVLIATFAALAIAAPTGTTYQKRAGVLGTKTYDEYVPSPLDDKTLLTYS
jgi:hypothetical protein